MNGARILTDPTFHPTVVETSTEQKYGRPERTHVAARSLTAKAPLVIFSAEDVPAKGFQITDSNNSLSVFCQG